MLYISFGFLAGILTGFISNVNIDNYILIAAFIVALIVGVKFFKVLAIAFFIAGLMNFQFFSSSYTDRQILDNYHGEIVNFDGEIVSLIKTNDERISFMAKVINSNDGFYGVMLLSCPKNCPNFKPSAIYNFTVKLKVIHAQLNFNGFDFNQYAANNDIIATGKILKSKMIYDIDKYSILHIRDNIAEYVINNSSDYSSVTGYILGLSIGDKRLISDDQYKLIQELGISHLLAISGLHIGLVFGWVFFVFRFLWLRSYRLSLIIRPNVIGCIFGLFFALGYSFLAGMAISTQRSLIMLFVASLFVFFPRKTSPYNVINAALLIVLIYSPLSILILSFWLSFGAVYFLLFLGIFDKDLRVNFDHGFLYKCSVWFMNLVKCQVGISLLMLPVGLYLFSYFSYSGLIVNLFAIPCIVFIVPIVLISILFSSELLLNLVAYYLTELFQLIEWFYALNWVSWHNISLTACVISTVFFLGVYFFNRFYLKALCLFIALAALVNFNGTKQGNFQLTVLNVGQGLSIAIRTENNTVLYDFGAAMFGAKSGQRVITPFLRANNVDEIDVAIISHSDEDHIGGYKFISENFEVNRTYSNDKYELCKANMNFQLDGVLFTFLSPIDNIDYIDKNSGSCVLLVQSADYNVLIMGDADTEAEHHILNHYELPKIDVLIAGHHGSKTSSSLEFLKAANPQNIVYSAGFKHRFNHPNKTVTDRVDSLGIKSFNTAVNGSISFNSFSGNVSTAYSKRDFFYR